MAIPACYARVLVACVGGAGFGLPAFWWGFRAVWCGCPLPFSAVVVGGLSVVVLLGVWCDGVCGWVYSLALTRSRLTDSRKRATAHGLRCPCACGCACRPCPCRLFLSVRQCYLFSVDNICRMVGGYFTAKRQPKNGEQYVSAHSHSHAHFSEHRTHPFGRRFRKPSQWWGRI